jgi:hypothetical protein
MKIIVAIAVFGLSMGFAAHIHAQSPHTITWTARGGNPGALVTIAGQQFRIARTPIRDLGSSRTFSLTFLAPRTGPVLTGFVLTSHSTAPLTNPIQIDGFDANVTVADGRNYTIVNNFASPGDYTFTVAAQAVCTVNVKVGQTLITLFATFSAVQQPDTDIGNTPNALPQAEWADYIHPTALVTGCNQWIDYVRIQELP